jgi:hypothetical protein
MDRDTKVVSPGTAGDVAAAGTLVVAGLLALAVLDDSASPSGGDLVSFVLWSLAAAVVVRALVARLW